MLEMRSFATHRDVKKSVWFCVNVFIQPQPSLRQPRQGVPSIVCHTDAYISQLGSCLTS